MTRTPTPSVSATDNDSTSPAKTLISVERTRVAYASTCSPSRAPAATRSASSSSSSATGGAADRHLGDAQGRLAGRDGDALPVLATGPRPGVEVRTDGVDVPERVGPVADELRGAHRIGDLTVLDEIRLGDT